MTQLTNALAPTFLLVLDGAHRNLTATSHPALLHHRFMVVLDKALPTTMKMSSRASPVALHHSPSRHFLLLSPLEVVNVSLNDRQLGMFLG